MGARYAKCESTARLNDKVAVITGCNTGIGKATATDFYQRGARVIMACRDLEKANAALGDIKNLCEDQESLGSLEVVELDLASLRSVRTCVQALAKVDRIDVLVNNAAVMVCPYTKTEDGFEMQFGTNHLGHFLFTLLLLPKMLRSTQARIINVSSSAYERVIYTELGRHIDTTYFWGAKYIAVLLNPRSKTLEQGAQTTIYCAVEPSLAGETGLYYDECRVATTALIADNLDDAARLWNESWKLVRLEEEYNPFVVNSTI